MKWFKFYTKAPRLAREGLEYSLKREARIPIFYRNMDKGQQWYRR